LTADPLAERDLVVAQAVATRIAAAPQAAARLICSKEKSAMHQRKICLYPSGEVQTFTRDFHSNLTMTSNVKL